MKAKKLPPSRRPAALAPASVRSRKMRSGSSGASTRVSIVRKAPMSAPATARNEIVRRLAQPSCGAFVTA